jgi:hypothetical protein
MSSRTIAVLVAVAVVAGIAVSAYGFATRGSTKAAYVLQIDEAKGRVGSVVLGETSAEVVSVLGKSQPHRPLPKPITPVTIANTTFLLYAHLVIELQSDRVVSVRTDNPAARTEKAIRIGDPISAVRASYRKAARCIPNASDKEDPHPRCTVKVPAGRLLVRGDPIKTLTLTRSG